MSASNPGALTCSITGATPAVSVAANRPTRPPTRGSPLDCANVAIPTPLSDTATARSLAPPVTVRTDAAPQLPATDSLLTSTPRTPWYAASASPARLAASSAPGQNGLALSGNSTGVA